MSPLTLEAIATGSDEEVSELLGEELGNRISALRDAPEFLAEIRGLPIGLRAMAATYELDVSLALDDLGWHFGKWHDLELAEETARGLEVLGALELAGIFREALALALEYWGELGDEDWSLWYPDSPLEEAMDLLNKEAWEFLKPYEEGIFHFWVAYARQHPEDVGAIAGPKPKVKRPRSKR
jgi:hypothetical protein